MRNFDTRLENLGATAAGRLSAAEDNVRFNEMENFITTAGIALDPQAGPDTDLNMMAQAAGRYASGATWATCSGSANAYALAVTGSFVPPDELFTGMRVIASMSATNTAASTVNVFGLGSKAIRTWDNKDLKGSEIIANEPAELYYDSTANGGAGAWLLVPWSSIFITSNVTLTVATSGGEFTTVQAALDSLKRKIIVAPAIVLISIGAGDFAPFVVSHPNAAQINIVGQTSLGVSTADVTVGAPATTETTLRAKFPTRIVASSANGVEVLSPVLGMLSDLLIIGSGAGSYDGVLIGVDGNARCPTSVLLNDLAIIRFGSRGVQARVLSKVHAISLLVAHSVSDGIWMDQGSVLTADPNLLISKANGGHGLFLSGSICDASGARCDNNGGAGVYAYNGAMADVRSGFMRTNTGSGILASRSRVNASSATLTGNTQRGIESTNDSFVDAGSATITTNTINDVLANVQSRTNLSAATYGTISPALNTNGNGNSYNRG